MNSQGLWEVTADAIKACVAIALVLTAIALLVVGVFALVDTTIDAVRSID